MLFIKRVTFIITFLFLVSVEHLGAQVSHDFEPESNFGLGDLNGQEGWQIDQGQASISTTEAYSGLQSVELSANNPFTQIRFEINQVESETVTFTDFYIKPIVGALELENELLDLEGALFGIFSNENNISEVYVNLNGVWEPTGHTVDLDANALTADWLRVTVRQDFGTSEGPLWDLYLNGQLVAVDLPLAEPNPSYPLSFIIMGQVGGPSYLDNFNSSDSNPLFTDEDRDGMDDAFELAHGSDPTINDRDGDADGDQISNIVEYMNAEDSDNDGLPDTFERQIISVNPNDEITILADVLPEDDFDRDGLTNSEEYANGMDPTDPDTDGDGLIDSREVPNRSNNSEEPVDNGGGTNSPNEQLQLQASRSFNQLVTNSASSFNSLVNSWRIRISAVFGNDTAPNQDTGEE